MFISLLSFYKSLELNFSISLWRIEINQSKEIFFFFYYFFLVLLLNERSEIFFKHFLDFKHIHNFIVNSVKGFCLNFFFFTVECGVFAQEIISLSAILHGFRFIKGDFPVFANYYFLKVHDVDYSWITSYLSKLFVAQFFQIIDHFMLLTVLLIVFVVLERERIMSKDKLVFWNFCFLLRMNYSCADSISLNMLNIVSPNFCNIFSGEEKFFIMNI